jgi:hypothetical protein
MSGVPKMARGKICLARGIHYCTNFLISSALLASLYCETYVYEHISDCTEIVYELPFLPNNTTSETLLHQSGALRSFDWKVITRAPARRWLDEYVTLGKTYYFLLVKQEVIAARVTSTFSSLSHTRVDFDWHIKIQLCINYTL